MYRSYQPWQNGRSKLGVQAATNHVNEIQPATDKSNEVQLAPEQKYEAQPAGDQFDGVQILESKSRDTARTLIRVLSLRPKIAAVRARTRKGESAVVVTFSPYKLSLLEKDVAKGKGKAKAAKLSKTDEGKCRPNKSKATKRIYLESIESSKSRLAKNSKKQLDESSDDEDDEWPCLICCETFSRPKEQWIQCQVCIFWAHLACTPGGDYFICHNCDSDDDDM